VLPVHASFTQAKNGVKEKEELEKEKEEPEKRRRLSEREKINKR